MKANNPAPGVSREQRISPQGLERLDQQLEAGINISTTVLSQWIKRYGEDARRIIKKHNRYRPELD